MQRWKLCHKLTIIKCQIFCRAQNIFWRTPGTKQNRPPLTSIVLTQTFFKILFLCSTEFIYRYWMIWSMPKWLLNLYYIFIVSLQKKFILYVCVWHTNFGVKNNSTLLHFSTIIRWPTCTCIRTSLPDVTLKAKNLQCIDICILWACVRSFILKSGWLDRNPRGTDWRIMSCFPLRRSAMQERMLERKLIQVSDNRHQHFSYQRRGVCPLGEPGLLSHISYTHKGNHKEI